MFCMQSRYGERRIHWHTNSLEMQTGESSTKAVGA
nr:MAG TPA: hypothetical protein [Caudoviricetes sp.]